MGDEAESGLRDAAIPAAGRLVAVEAEFDDDRMTENGGRAVGEGCGLLSAEEVEDEVATAAIALPLVVPNPPPTGRACFVAIAGMPLEDAFCGVPRARLRDAAVGAALLLRGGVVVFFSFVSAAADG